MESRKFRYNLVFILLLMQLTPAVVKAEYVLPENDYWPSSVSKPCVSGEISSIGPSFIFVSSNKKNIKVGIASDTSLATVYGGYISKQQLKPRQKLKVWYKGKSCKKPEIPLIAAKVIIASKSPNDNWPRPEKSKLLEQHFAMLLLSANYYCTRYFVHKRWPNDLQALYAYYKKYDFPAGRDANWKWLLSNEVKYKGNDKYQLVSKSVYDGELITLVSFQDKPTCGFFTITPNGVKIKKNGEIICCGRGRETHAAP